MKRIKTSGLCSSLYVVTDRSAAYIARLRRKYGPELYVGNVGTNDALSVEVLGRGEIYRCKAKQSY